jgi:predicted nucleotidyltransferase
MRRDDALSLLRNHSADVVRRFGVKALSLFGSVARDEARPGSDVDVLVEFKGPTTFDAHMGLMEYLEDLLGCRVDVVTTGGLKPRLRARIEGELIRVT